VEKDRIGSAAKELGGVGRGLIIGIAAYQSINQLPSVVLKDAKDVASVLTAPHYCGYKTSNVNMLLDNEATLSNIRNALEKLSNESQEEDSVFIYFSGHGGLLAGPSEFSALLPVDFSSSTPQPSYLSDSEFSNALKKIRARRIVVILDACHSGGAVSFKSDGYTHLKIGFSEKSVALLSSGIGKVIIASSRENEVSLILGGDTNSVFTKHLVDAMRGNCRAQGDGFIRVFDLFNHVSSKVNLDAVARCGTGQHPQFKAHNLEDNFPIALDAGGAIKGASNPKPLAANSRELSSVFCDLYPSGPTDQSIWARAGGDLSRLKLNGTGQSMWFDALKLLNLGGGGASINLAVLVETALEDFPHHPTLNGFRGS